MPMPAAINIEARNMTFSSNLHSGPTDPSTDQATNTVSILLMVMDSLTTQFTFKT